ncbi:MULTISPECIES: GcrA family cell cycle regulator [Paracoccus]|jgi:GcrA cell cycle regulator|uniref:GcrA family cell cycle regulator n=1 Tax=Paracoccus TaxID=265 RepID=UPI0005DDE020|nr:MULTISPECIES: GcrA family cell cycle regulator [Paracoccus]KIX18296.1 GcrA cell cycle regulator [Paracoccus sp. 228]MBF5079717.1 GcrA cell cycle regulator [Paracoccus sp. NBH48]
MSWTDDRVETLKRMWSEGQSASAIAKELGGVTRNAVIGKVHRLGLSNRTEEPEAAAPAPAPAPEPVAREKPAAPRAVPQPAAAPLRPEPAPEPVAVQPEPEPEPSTQPAFVPVPRRPIVPAGQPLPPQPSANEISPEALASVREVEKRAKKLTLMELTERTCKWPIGDPATDKFWFCGLPSVAGKPYCEAHVGVAFQPMSSRRDRRR